MPFVLGGAFLEKRKWKVAIIGAGPAGIYVSDILLKQLKKRAKELRICEDAQVDIFEKAAAPYGLVRYGVAPDHPGIKYISSALDRALSAKEVRLYCNVCFGKDIFLDDLLLRYDSVVFATGAGEDRKWEKQNGMHGVCPAGEIVKWYNASPFSSSPNLKTKAACIIGGGNVALDVLRMLLQNPYALLETDMPHEVWETLAESEIEEAHVFIRSGVDNIKFSALEIRQLKECCQVILDDFSRDSLLSLPNSENKNVQQVRDELKSENGRRKRKKACLHFNAFVSSLIGHGALEAVEVERRSFGRTEPMFCLKTQLCISAIGYDISKLPGIPYDEQKHVIKNDRGRVQERVYSCGWAKRGCVGLIGSTKSDALETVETMLLDWRSIGRGPSSDSPIEELLEGRHVEFSGKGGWKRLENYEAALGKPQGKRSVKVKSDHEMKRISGM